MTDPWTQVAEELERGEKDKGLWLKAEVKAGSGSSEQDIRLIYAGLRVKLISEEQKLSYEETDKEDGSFQIDDAALTGKSEESSSQFDCSSPKYSEMVSSTPHFDPTFSALPPTTPQNVYQQKIEDTSNMSWLFLWIGGHLSLPFTYWVMAFLVNSLLGFTYRLIGPYIGTEASASLGVPISIYGIASALAVFRSSYRYQGFPLWKYLAYIPATIGMILSLSALIVFVGYFM